VHAEPASAKTNVDMRYMPNLLPIQAHVQIKGRCLMTRLSELPETG
jgi:hypothetical protein